MHKSLLLAVVLVAGFGTAHGQSKLEWKWKEGETFYALNVRQVNQKLLIDDPSGDAKKRREVNQVYEIGSRTRFRVKSKDASGTIVLEQVVERMELKNSKGIIVPVPSVQDATLTFQVTAKGEVSDIKGYEAVLKKLADQGAEREFLKNIFSEQTLKQNLQEIFDVLPPPNSKNGEKWTRKSDYDLGTLGKLNVTRTFTLVGDEKKDTRTVTRLGLNAASSQTFAKDKREVSAKGNLYFDPERGRLVAIEITRTLRSASKIKFDVEQPCELEQTETVTIQIMDKEPD